MERRFRAVEIFHKFPNAALIVHGVIALLLRLVGRGRTLVRNGDSQTRVQKRLLPHPGMERIVIVNRVLKHLRVGLECHGGAGMVRGAHHGHRLRHMAPGEFHLIDFPVPVHLHRQPFGQGVHHAGAHAMEAAGHLIAASAELAAGMEHGVYHLQRGLTGLGLNIHRDAPAVIHNGDGVALVDGHGDLRAEAGQRLVDGVVHDLVYQMMQSGGRGGADIHTRPLPHGLQPLQHLNFRCVILVGGVHRRGLQNFVLCHTGSPFAAGH